MNVVSFSHPEGAAMHSVKEFLVSAKLDALNAEIERLGLSAGQIVTILFVPGTSIGHGPGDRFRVLYWREAPSQPA